MEPIPAVLLLSLSLVLYCLALQVRRALFSVAEGDLPTLWPGRSLPLIRRVLNLPRRVSLALWILQRVSLLGMTLGGIWSLQAAGLASSPLYALLGVSMAMLLGRALLGPWGLGVDPVSFFGGMSRGVWLVDRLLGPVGTALDRGSRAVGRLLCARGGGSLEEYLAEQDLLGLVERGSHQGALEKEEHRMIHRVLEFRDRHVSRVMTPRADMFCLPLDTGLAQARAAVRQAGYSRVPVYRENKDDVVGILFAKDLLRLNLPGSDKSPCCLSELVRPAFFVPVQMGLGDLLEELRRRRLHMALCVDEYGGVSGLVTMEDVLEELFGEIYDEYDLEVRRWEPMGEGTYLVSGKLGLHEMEGLLGVHIAEQECNTVAGLVLKRLGHFPVEGEEVEVAGLRLKVEKVGPTRILAVRVQPRGKETQ